VHPNLDAFGAVCKAQRVQRLVALAAGGRDVAHNGHARTHAHEGWLHAGVWVCVWAWMRQGK
jgi:hypothetical protein